VDRLQWLNESGLSKQTPDQASKIGAVLFSLWAKGHRERSKAAATFIPLVSGVFGLVLALLLLPENSISRLPEIAFSALATACISFSSVFSQSEARIGFFVFVFMFLIKERVTGAKPRAVECGVGVDGATD